MIVLQRYAERVALLEAKRQAHVRRYLPRVGPLAVALQFVKSSNVQVLLQSSRMKMIEKFDNSIR